MDDGSAPARSTSRCTTSLASSWTRLAGVPSNSNVTCPASAETDATSAAAGGTGCEAATRHVGANAPATTAPCGVSTATEPVKGNGNRNAISVSVQLTTYFASSGVIVRSSSSPRTRNTWLRAPLPRADPAIVTVAPYGPASGDIHTTAGGGNTVGAASGTTSGGPASVGGTTAASAVPVGTGGTS